MESIAGADLYDRDYKVVREGRKSGILCHITSLASPYGIGSLGDEARNFIDFLILSGQTRWQVLPLGVTGYGNSPYQTLSDKAGNPYLIDLDELIRENLLEPDAPEQFEFGRDPGQVDFDLMWKNRKILLRLAWEAFQGGGHDALEHAFNVFCLKEEGDWLHDYALFMTIKEAQGGAAWRSWPEALKQRDPLALLEFEQTNQEAIRFEKFLQFLFFRQWQQIRDYASRAGVGLIGDLPLYVAEDSVEVWLEPAHYQLDEHFTPILVAGCPPDDFSDDGQLWGNPLYDWRVHEAENYRWWTERLRFQLRLYDLIRIDHFRGLESYWAVPYGDKTARRGRWLPGPADALFEAVEKTLGPLPLLAEDLGTVTREVHAFRERTGFPGMKILQFAFNPEATSDYLPHNLTEHAILYTGTHDNSTIAGWLETADPDEIAFAVRYLGLNEAEGLVQGIMRGAATSVCQTVIFQMQDLLELGNASRMNRPGRSEGNWRWRMLPGVLTLERAKRLRELTRMSGRLP